MRDEMTDALDIPTCEAAGGSLIQNLLSDSLDMRHEASKFT